MAAHGKPDLKDEVTGDVVVSNKGKIAASKKNKVVYEKPGQTRPTPTPDEPLYKFYMSLLEQTPDSHMANKWCIQHGVCSEEHAVAWLARNKPATQSPSKKGPARSVGTKSARSSGSRDASVHTKSSAKAAKEARRSSDASSGAKGRKAPKIRPRSEAGAASAGTGKNKPTTKRKSRDIAWESDDDLSSNSSEDEAAPPVSSRSRSFAAAVDPDENAKGGKPEAPLKAPLKRKAPDSGKAVHGRGSEHKEAHNSSKRGWAAVAGKASKNGAKFSAQAVGSDSESDEDLPLAQRRV